MTTLRTPESEKKYKDLIAQGLLEKGCALCRAEPTKVFARWKIIPNDFPYDRIASTHDMIVPTRHVSEEELTAAEREEFKEIKEAYLNQAYEYIIEPTHKMKSIPAHFHLHLIVSK